MRVVYDIEKLIASEAGNERMIFIYFNKKVVPTSKVVCTTLFG